MVVYTQVDTSLKRKRALFCFLFSGLGALMLLLFGSFAPLPFLSQWGLWIFLCSLLLIAIGFIPYRRLQAVDLMPHSITLKEGCLLYQQGNKGRLVIPVQTVASLSYYEGVSYGIKLELTNKKTLFLPYFNRKEVEKLKQAVAL